jgi:hypothetical protein
VKGIRLANCAIRDWSYEFGRTKKRGIPRRAAKYPRQPCAGGLLWPWFGLRNWFDFSWMEDFSGWGYLVAGSTEFMTQITRAQRQLHAFILSMVWNATDADDVLQQTNLVLWEKSAEFDASRPFLPWAMRFAQ